MRFDILTLFPDMFDPIIKESITGRAIQKGIIEINTVNIRYFSKNKHGKTDDYPYGGGSGMLMTAQPIYDACMQTKKGLTYNPKVIYMTPQGNTLNQQKVKEFSLLDGLMLLCGHYEGVDERVVDEIIDEQISIGDYVLTGGELPAMVLIDAVSRMLPGVLSGEDAYTLESHYDKVLEYPQYTRPEVFMGNTVPQILLSGNHEEIRKWKRAMSLVRTRQRRPDLFNQIELTDEDKELIEKYSS